MATIVEIYPNIDEVKQQVEYRKTFGWRSSVSINDRGVYEVTFTRDDRNPINQKLKRLEHQFEDCSNAEDFIERYNTKTVDKKKFKAFHPFFLLVVIYIVFSMLLQGVVLAGVGAVYRYDPQILFTNGFEIAVDGEKFVLDDDWSYSINLEEKGLDSFFKMFGYNEKTFALTLDIIMDLFLYVGIGSLAIAIIVLIFAISKKSHANMYYKAEVEYVNNRKDLLNSKLDYLEERINEILDEAESI